MRRAISTRTVPHTLSCCGVPDPTSLPAGSDSNALDVLFQKFREKPPPPFVAGRERRPTR